MLEETFSIAVVWHTLIHACRRGHIYAQMVVVSTCFLKVIVDRSARFG